MQKLANAVEDAGFRALNLDYPSRRASVAELAESVFAEVWDTCGTAHEVHVVAHSMGAFWCGSILLNTTRRDSDVS